MVKRSPRAFTLIEVLAVLVILSITVGIGYTLLTSATQSSYSQIAQGYVNQVQTAEQNFYQQYGTYTPYPNDLSGISVPLVVVNTAATTQTEVSIAVGATTGDLGIAYLDGTNTCQLELVPPPVTATTAESTPTTMPTVSADESCVPSLALAVADDSPVTPTSGGTDK